MHGFADRRSQKGSELMLVQLFLRLAQQAAQQAARQAASFVGGTLRSGANDIRLYVRTNPWSVTVLSFLGGLVLMSSFIGLFWLPGILNPLAYILQFYQAFFGFLICMIDGPASTRFPMTNAKVLQHASFLANNYSRALFYLFIACWEGSQNRWWDWAIGWYFAAIAVLYVAVQLVQRDQSRDLSAPLATS
ncbi:unnamed protein product [Prorocentrum cordatum]|uniref:Uncharacterized protein n=1 Tax=Prorocentrum cordatum TaxID=2364126 RepID=A0ABN9VN48_9DINO|nr:unnamed protein product [Polarella glacialis]